MDDLDQETNEPDQYQVHGALQEYLIHSREIRNPQIRLEDTPYANRGQRKEQDREHKENGENDEERDNREKDQHGTCFRYAAVSLAHLASQMKMGASGPFSTTRKGGREEILVRRAGRRRRKDAVHSASRYTLDV